MAKTNLGFTTATKTTSYTLTEADDVVYFNISSDATATLPNAASVANRQFTIKRIDSTASTILSIATTGGQTVDGRPSSSIRLSAKDSIIVRSNGTNWIIESLDETFILQYQNNSGASIAWGTATLMPYTSAGIATHPALWSGSRFTATFPMKVLVTAQVSYPANMGTAEISIEIRKNGATYYNRCPMGESGAAVPAAMSVNAQAVVDLQTNEYIEIYTWQSLGSPSKPLNTSGSCSLTIVKVGNN